MAESIHIRIERERKSALPEAWKLPIFRDYARGRQRGTLTKEQYTALRSLLGNRFCDNVCRMILLAATGRLQLARYEVVDPAVVSWLKEFWTLTQLPVLAQQVHWATLRDGNHAVALAWDTPAARVRLARERWWDGRSGIFIAYDDLDQPQYAVKDWDATGTNGQRMRRRVIWWPDRIERYIQDGAGWRPYRLPGETAWPVPWVGRDKQPLGLPMIHFRNIYLPDDADDADGAFGVSELDGGILGLQDEVNDVQRDISAAARYTGYQMYWGSGLTLEKDAAGNVKEPVVEPGRFHTSKDPGSRFGVFPAGDLAQLLRALTVKLQAVSRQSSTPLHLITGGDWPSGEALLRSEQPLIQKVQTVGQVFAPAWASVAHRATVLANFFGNANLNLDALISARYRPADRTDPVTRATVAGMLAPFVSEAEVLRILDYGPDELARILSEREGDRQAQTNLADLALQAFNRGPTPPGPTGNPPPVGAPPGSGGSNAVSG